MSDSLPKLSGKMQVWADAYIGEARFNASEAARIAGYKWPRRSGQDNLKNPLIQQYISQVLQQSAVSRDEILTLVAEDARRTEDEIFNITAKTGSEIVQSSLVSSLVSARTSARTNLMKAHGLFIEKREVSGPNGGPIQHTGIRVSDLLTPDELDSLATEIKRKQEGRDGDSPD